MAQLTVLPVGLTIHASSTISKKLNEERGDSVRPATTKAYRKFGTHYCTWGVQKGVGINALQLLGRTDYSHISEVFITIERTSGCVVSCDKYEYTGGR